MYNGYNSSITNNPFIGDSTSAQSRYPDLSGSSPSPDPSGSQFTSWLKPGGSQQQYEQQYHQQIPPQFSGIGYQPTGAIDGNSFITPQFQPSSGFGQQMLGQMTGSSYSYLQGQNTSALGQTSYNPVQQQLQSPGYNNIAQFDPYSLIGGQGGNSSSAQHQPPSFQSPTSPISPTTSITTSRSASGAIHPREYIKTHKAEVESWDPYAWKQLLNAFDDLKEAWASRKNEIDGRAQQLLMQMQYSGGYHPQMQQEAERLRTVSFERSRYKSRCAVRLFCLLGPILIITTMFTDSVAASSFQMHEVFKGYRQSGDAASKRRVREASNAALQSIPDWPAPAF
ncbi:hypothetical protein EV359DRAFT_41713 [Lentinula novae-zelandiae]|nr:hypothetical protein EV359DRAFT_41713 [Lentinula novae-zelandiae]